MNIILFGAPGAGKGTQASNIVLKYNLLHISTGDMFRQAIKDQTEMGKLANNYISKGSLVPDEVTVGLVKERLNMPDAKKGFILDGFPRTLYQAECLEKILEELNTKIDHVIDIEVNNESVIERISGRRLCKNCGASYHIKFNPSKVLNVCDKCNGQLYTRDDDNANSVAVRLEAYENQSKPLINYYLDKDLIRKINGEQNVDDVFNDIVKKLG